MSPPPDRDRFDEDDAFEPTDGLRGLPGDGAPGDDLERYLDAIERGRFVGVFRLLLRDGVKLPSPESVSDEDITTALWAVIGGLAARRIFLTRTDHLSDRALYERLWFHLLRHAVPDARLGSRAAWVLDVGAAGGDDDRRVAPIDAGSAAPDAPRPPPPSAKGGRHDRDRFLPRPEDAWSDAPRTGPGDEEWDRNPDEPADPASEP